MSQNNREPYEDRLREKHPDKLWWENWRENKWLFFWIGLAIVTMIVVGFAVG